MEEAKAKIVIADSQMLIIEALKRLLDGHESFELVSVIECKELLLWQLQKTQANLLIIDPQTLNLQLIIDLQEIVCELPQLKILLLVNSIEQSDVLKLKNIGLQNILLKTADHDDFSRALTDTIKGKKFYSESIMEMLLKSKEDKTSGQYAIQLTQSEKEVARLIVEGITTKEIAARKFISFHTVMTHRKNIFKKLGINSTSELVMYAVKAGIVDAIEYHI